MKTWLRVARQYPALIGRASIVAPALEQSTPYIHQVQTGEQTRREGHDNRGVSKYYENTYVYYRGGGALPRN